jgi:hypothetical protein
MMRNAWHISGGDGWCANSSNRRVLVIRKGGRQTVEEVENDLGINKEDTEAILASLKAQGILDIISIVMTSVQIDVKDGAVGKTTPTGLNLPKPPLAPAAHPRRAQAPATTIVLG